MGGVPSAGAGASPSQRAIRASRALRARRDYGVALGEGHVAAYWEWTASQRGATPERADLLPLVATLDALWGAALCALVAPEEGACG